MTPASSNRALGLEARSLDGVVTTPRRLILWDIDGTLLSAGPVGRTVFDRAVEEVLGRHPGEHGVSMGGKTDPQIALEILAATGVLEGDREARLAAVLAALERHTGAAWDAMRMDGRIHPGVESLLARLHGHTDVAQSVLTGNLQPNARAKVAAFGLDHYLDLEIGAYGSDDQDRTKLVPVALRRLRTVRGVQLRPDQTWIVGDTPRDLACARAGGSRCLLVATGHHPFEELVSLNADEVLRDLSDEAAVVRILV